MVSLPFLRPKWTNVNRNVHKRQRQDLKRIKQSKQTTDGADKRNSVRRWNYPGMGTPLRCATPRRHNLETLPISQSFDCCNDLPRTDTFSPVDDRVLRHTVDYELHAEPLGDFLFDSLPKEKGVLGLDKSVCPFFYRGVCNIDEFSPSETIEGLSELKRLALKESDPNGYAHLGLQRMWDWTRGNLVLSYITSLRCRMCHQYLETTETKEFVRKLDYVDKMLGEIDPCCLGAGLLEWQREEVMVWYYIWLFELE